MPNVTLSIDEETLKAGREYARLHGTSLNALIRKLLSERVRSDSGAWLDELFEMLDRAGGDSKGRTWTREELYRGFSEDE